MIPVLSDPAELRGGIAAKVVAIATTATNAATSKRVLGCLTFFPSEHFQSHPLLSADDGLAFSHTG